MFKNIEHPCGKFEIELQEPEKCYLLTHIENEDPHTIFG